MPGRFLGSRKPWERVRAAVEAQTGQAKGIDSSLRALAAAPGGPWLLVLAVGLVMLGFYSCAEARWRRV
jgi:hypothetical protein